MAARAFSFPPPAFGECGHGGLARRRVAVRGRPVFVVPEGERPQPEISRSKQTGSLASSRDCMMARGGTMFRAPILYLLRANSLIGSNNAIDCMALQQLRISIF
jgi:hypothetical protein